MAHLSQQQAIRICIKHCAVVSNSWTWSCRWNTCPSVLMQMQRASCSWSAWRSLGICCWCTERLSRWSSSRAKSNRSSVSAAEVSALNHCTYFGRTGTFKPGGDDSIFVFRYRLLHASQRGDNNCHNKPQRSCGHVTQPAEEGNGSRGLVFCCGRRRFGFSLPPEFLFMFLWHFGCFHFDWSSSVTLASTSIAYFDPD